ncbi:MAG: TerC/Alx family metal homeostasis membrane protein [Pirellulales bacterium]|nr:TerC/Alx family metal homeostasis membrane protein [Pirellulales bacterium]
MSVELHFWHWIEFGALVVFLLTLDLFVFHKHDHTPSLKESAWWTVFWISLAFVFNGALWYWAGHEVGSVWLTGYLIEKALSMDNIFVFVVIFRFFAIPLMYQYRVLFWGILGAVFMRLLFIVAGVELIDRFDWVIPVFGAFLIYTAFKLVRHSGTEVHPENNVVLRTARRVFRITKHDHREHGHAFFIRENDLLCITPMFLVLLVIESTDVVFAVDSVPAVLGVIPSSYPVAWRAFIAFTSNVFAILGLRALYFLLAGVVDLFRYLHYGLAGVLGFVGLKMMAEYTVKLAIHEAWISQAWFPWVDPERGGHLVPTWVSLLTIALLLIVSMVASVLVVRHEQHDPAGPPSEPVEK